MIQLNIKIGSMEANGKGNILIQLVLCKINRWGVTYI